MNGTTTHPFLEGKRYRSDELGEAVVTSAHWRWTSWVLILGIIILGSVWGLREMTRPAIKVMMLQVDESGTTRILGPLPDKYIPTEQVIKRELRTFVEVLRRVLTDNVAMGDDWDKKKGIYGRVTKEGRKLLNQYVNDHGDPLSKKEPVMVEVVRILAKSGKTMDVQWIEKRFNDRLEPMETSYWSGLFSYEDRPARTEAEFYVNPTGIWWHAWSFGKDR